MAFKWPALCQDTTNTSGPGTYTLNDDVINGRRTLTDAVAQSDLASGDTIAYCVYDDTVAGGPLLFEYGYGVYDNTAKTVTRVVVHQPAAGAQSWGSNAKNFIVIDDPLVFFMLTGGTITGLIHVLLTGSAISPATETGGVIQRSSAGDAGFSIISHTSGIARLNLGDSAAEKQGGLTYDNSTDALSLRSNNATRATMSSAGVFTDSAGKIYIAFAGGGVTALPFYQSATPVGWTRVVTGIEGCTMRLVHSGGGSPTISGRQDVATLDTELTAMATGTAQLGAGQGITTDVSANHFHEIKVMYAEFGIMSKD